MFSVTCTIRTSVMNYRHRKRLAMPRIAGYRPRYTLPNVDISLIINERKGTKRKSARKRVGKEEKKVKVRKASNGRKAKRSRKKQG